MPEEVIEKPGEPTPTESVQEPQDTTATQDVPETPEELKGRLDALQRERDDALRQNQEAQGLIGRHTEELNQLRNDNAFYRSQGQNQGQQQPHPPGPQQGSPVGSAPEYDPYDADSVKKYSAYQQNVMDDKLNKFAGFVQNAVMTGDAMSKVREIVNSDPEHFKDIGQETINMVSNLAKAGTVDPNLIGAEDTVYGCAAMVRDYKKRASAQPVSPVQAVAPTAIDTPAPVRPNEPEKQLDTGIAQEIVDTFYGGDRELATKSARESKARGEK